MGEREAVILREGQLVCGEGDERGGVPGRRGEGWLLSGALRLP